MQKFDQASQRTILLYARMRENFRHEHSYNNETDYQTYCFKHSGFGERGVVPLLTKAKCRLICQLPLRQEQSICLNVKKQNCSILRYEQSMFLSFLNLCQYPLCVLWYLITRFVIDISYREGR